MRYFGIIGLALAVASPALASDDNGFAAISAGDFKKAARQLEAANQLFPNKPEIMLNLAAVYVKTGKMAQARALYSDVLAQPEVAMDMPSGNVLSSHAVATRGMDRVQQVIASR